MGTGMNAEVLTGPSEVPLVIGVVETKKEVG